MSFLGCLPLCKSISWIIRWVCNVYVLRWIEWADKKFISFLSLRNSQPHANNRMLLLNCFVSTVCCSFFRKIRKWEIICYEMIGHWSMRGHNKKMSFVAHKWVCLVLIFQWTCNRREVSGFIFSLQSTFCSLFCGIAYTILWKALPSY